MKIFITRNYCLLRELNDFATWNIQAETKCQKILKLNIKLFYYITFIFKSTDSNTLI